MWSVIPRWVRKKTVYNFESGGNGVARQFLGATVTACKGIFFTIEEHDLNVFKTTNSCMLSDLS